MRAPVLLSLALVLATSSVMASQVHYEETELQELIDRADLIVVAEVLDPPRTISSVPITPKGKKPDADKYPDFRAVVLHFSSTETLSSRGKIELPAKLNVVGATVGQQFDLHRRYYVDGLSKSPIYRRYESKGEPIKLEPGNRVILFLRATTATRESGSDAPLNRALAKMEPRFSFVVDGAMEKVSLKKEILRLLDKKRP